VTELGVAAAAPEASADPDAQATPAVEGPKGSVQLSLFAAATPEGALALPGETTEQTLARLRAETAEAPVSSRHARRARPLAREARLATEPQRLGAVLAAGLRPYLPPGKGIALTVTENHYSMIAVRRRADGYAVRIHRMFLSAEPRVVRALARYVVHNDVRASRLLGEFIESHQHEIAPKPARTRALVLRTAGQFHDLQVLFDELNSRFFAGSLDARITWGPAPRRRGPRRSIKMGSYAVEDRLIRVHPALDRADVPGFFVSWIVFHEMLHGKHDILRQGRRRIFHSAAFLADERTYPDFERATAWEKANLDRLLASL